MSDKKGTMLSKLWKKHVQWSIRTGMLGDFFVTYICLMVVNVPLNILIPDIGFLSAMAILIPLSFVISHYRGKYLTKSYVEIAKSIQNQHEYSEKVKEEEKKEQLKMEGKVCISVCRGCDKKIYDKEHLHKNKLNHSFCSECYILL